MQNAQDSFYVALRNRLALISPTRTMILRAVERPGIFVQCAEAPTAEPPSDVFILQWTKMAAVAGLTCRLWSMECNVRYFTSGSQPYGGLDRGRSLSQMDCELAHMTRPLRTAKLSYCSDPPTVLETQVFWNAPMFGSLETLRDQVSRAASITVFTFEEPGES